MYERHIQLRNKIENSINSGEFEIASKLVEDYELLAPKDMELVNYKSLLKIYTGDLETATKILEDAIIQYPLNLDINYNMAYVYEQLGDLERAFEYYVRMKYLCDCNGESEKYKDLRINESTDILLETIVEKYVREQDIESLNKLKDRRESYFGLVVKYFRDSNPCIGKEIWFSDNEKRFITFQRSIDQSGVPESVRSLLYMKCEMLSCQLTSSFSINEPFEREYLIPISTIEEDTIISIVQDGDLYKIRPCFSNHFDYYKVKSGSVIKSDKVFQCGNPIILGHDKNRKKLVLNIFVDGLSQTILNGNDLKRNMPNTYEFFSKGVICTNAHSASEWTYPSLATYVSGLCTVNHMLYHNTHASDIRRDITTLAEYFKKSGYHTAKIDGDWRSVPNYGHTRGIDRYIYQNQCIGLKAEQMIGEIIEHLETFKEADRYLWVCFDDLHNIADGFSSPSGVHHLMELDDWEMDEVGETSAKQNYSEKKKNRFIKGARHLDVLLNVLYKYISDNYNDDEILISLFADHGQGYLIKENAHFISQGRTNVAFMFRGGLQPLITDELISSCDYKMIMCKLAGIELEDELTDGHLPVVFGGNQERDWVISESIHPGDPYYATFYTKDKIFYFENGEKTQNDGRFKLKDYKITVEDYNGNVLNDDSFSEKFKKIMMDHVSPLIMYAD